MAGQLELWLVTMLLLLHIHVWFFFLFFSFLHCFERNCVQWWIQIANFILEIVIFWLSRNDRSTIKALGKFFINITTLKTSAIFWHNKASDIQYELRLDVDHTLRWLNLHDDPLAKAVLPPHPGDPEFNPDIDRSQFPDHTTWTNHLYAPFNEVTN